MRLLVGLGNPGPRYQRNRHNIGFMAAEAVAAAHGFGPWRRRFRGELAEGRMAGQKILALKPQTYMNASGEAVGEAARFFKLAPERVIVLHDDLDLAPGRVKVKLGGGNAGHNGLRSIDAHLGNGFWRVRLGIGHPGDKALVHDYVLHDFSKAEAEQADALCEAVAGEMPRLVAGDAEAFMSRVAHLLAPPRAAGPAAEGAGGGPGRA